MYLQLTNYNHANEILYVLKSVKDRTNNPISKLGVQKILYLSASLAPIKNIVLSIVKFITQKRGPYSSDIQNTLDNLIAYGLVEILSFKTLANKKYSVASYQITDGGINAISSLTKYDKEEEIFWWIDIITQVAYMYSTEKGLKEVKDFSGLDTIVKLVYQDPTFNQISRKHGKYALIDLGGREGLTSDLINISKNYLLGENSFSSKSERHKAELILLSFFEYLYSKYLDEVSE
jgi:hypothetical protein